MLFILLLTGFFFETIQNSFLRTFSIAESRLFIIIRDAQTTSRQGGGANSENFQNSRGRVNFPFEIFSERNFPGGLHPLWASLIITVIPRKSWSIIFEMLRNPRVLISKTPKCDSNTFGHRLTCFENSWVIFCLLFEFLFSFRQLNPNIQFSYGHIESEIRESLHILKLNLLVFCQQ